MGKLLRLFSIFLVVAIFGLAGCSVQTAKKAELEQKVADFKERVENEKKINEKDGQKEEQRTEKQMIEEKQPVAVHVVDPNTKQVIKTFFPGEMGFEANSKRYEQMIESWARDMARGTETTEGYDRRMNLDRLGENGQIIKGTPEVILEESELAEKIMAASRSGGTVELPLYTTYSGYKPEEVANLGEEMVASYTTHFNTGVAGRSRNIELSAQAINNVILGSGDKFSFNSTVGPSDEAHGYQPAEEAIKGKLVMGIGGGICQTSSTLFNTVDQIGVSYIERNHHSVNVGYVPKGRDATVSYGGVDFRFQNTTGVHLLIKAHTNNGALTVELRTSKANQALIK